jgi:hypothetical protein
MQRKAKLSKGKQSKAKLSYLVVAASVVAGVVAVVRVVVSRSGRRSSGSSSTRSSSCTGGEELQPRHAAHYVREKFGMLYGPRLGRGLHLPLASSTPEVQNFYIVPCRLASCCVARRTRPSFPVHVFVACVVRFVADARALAPAP